MTQNLDTRLQLKTRLQSFQTPVAIKTWVSLNFRSVNMYSSPDQNISTLLKAPLPIMPRFSLLRNILFAYGSKIIRINEKLFDV